MKKQKKDKLKKILHEWMEQCICADYGDLNWHEQEKYLDVAIKLLEDGYEKG